MQANATTSIGKFYDVKNGLKSIVAFSENDKLSLQSYYHKKNVLQDSLLAIRVEWSNAGNPPSQSYLEELQNLYKELHPINDAIATIYSTRKQTIINELPNLISENNAISTTTNYELSEKNVNQLYFDWLLSESNILTETQVLTLEVIASQCPLAGGDAVYRARGLLALTDSIYTFDDEQLCNASPPFFNIGQGSTSQQSTAIDIFPNPTKSTLHIHWPELIETGAIVLYDLNGQEVMRRRIKEQFSISIDVHTLPPGLYQGALTSEGSQLYFFKAVVAQ